MGSGRRPTILDSTTHYNSVAKLSCFMISWLQWSIKTLQVIVFLLSLMRHGSGYEAGAPVEACWSLSPDHNPYPPQDPSVSPSPYVVEISASKLEGHQQDVSIRLSGSYFTGFLLQVHDDQGSTTGQFVSNSRGSQFLTCHTKNDSITHTSGRLKREMEFTWRASGVLDGKNYLKGTIVKTMQIFWTNVTFEFPSTPQEGTDNTRKAVSQHDMNRKHDDL